MISTEKFEVGDHVKFHEPYITPFLNVKYGTIQAFSIDNKFVFLLIVNPPNAKDTFRNIIKIPIENITTINK
jgi:hypothetical protein